MTDLELLELAAKAIGSELYWLDDCSPAIDGRLWNPLDDDGDALRLAVRLNLLGAHIYEHAIGVAGMIDAEPYAATRRAITRAAAYIGKCMQ